MARGGDIFIVFAVLAITSAVILDNQFTGNVVYQEGSASAELCRNAGYADNCLFVQRKSASGPLQQQQLSEANWEQELADFGVACNNIREGKMVLDENGALELVEVIIGKGGGFCKFNDDLQLLAEGARIVYTSGEITAFLPPVKKGMLFGLFGAKQTVIPKLVSSEVFPSSSQASTRNSVKVCFEGADKNSLVNVKIKSQSGEVTEVAAYDDANHFDGAARDGCYGAVLDGLLAQGQYSLSYVISA